MVGKVEAFIARWLGREGGQERANYALFLTELCTVLDLPQPEPAEATADGNDYVFERGVRETARDGSSSVKRIDLYKRDCFILEAKQSRFVGEKTVTQSTLPAIHSPVVARGRRGADRGWDVLMHNARSQAENYVRLLPAAHEPPPFVLVCDVGHCIEVYANFRRDGKAYDQFPDRRSFRIYLEDLRDEAVRDRLRGIWTNPMALDPSRRAARVTRDIAERLAKVSVALEKAGHAPEEVAMFLMRLLFTMFAEDVELLPKDSFKSLLKDCVADPVIFPGMLEDLWRAMDEGTFSAALRQKAKKFNGEFFKNRQALALPKEEIGELLAAAERNWREVEPAIFGTLLEQALDPTERRRLGAHYTPRAYVERLVIATVIDPLREDWAEVLSTAERQKAAGRGRDAIATVQAFHDRLCETRVLDPACGTGNFLYVSLELMKRLEGEVLEAVADLGGQEALTGLASHTVDPHQFLGMELNPRAAAIAELVLWIGHLQWHVRTKGGEPGEPILKAFHNIQVKDAVLTWDGYPLVEVVGDRKTYPNPRRPDWPKADFIVGNPPFIGKGEPMRTALSDDYLTALRKAHAHLDDGIDLVMYWWDTSADLLTRKGTRLKRFGYVTTKTISQVMNRRVIARHFDTKPGISLTYTIPNHPWTKATEEFASVRIAMTVAVRGIAKGVLERVESESGLETDHPLINFQPKLSGKINADLSIGVDVTNSHPLLASSGLSWNGVMLSGRGFIVDEDTSVRLSEDCIKTIMNGNDFSSLSLKKKCIDFYGLSEEEARIKYPKSYQILLETLKNTRINNRDESFRSNWWLFGRNRPAMREGIAGLERYIATIETTRYRVFQFIGQDIIPEHKLTVFLSGDAYILGILSSNIHRRWAEIAGGKNGVGNDPVYVKSMCFDRFPFPIVSKAMREVISRYAEEIDMHRKDVMRRSSRLNISKIYNVLGRLYAGTEPADLDHKERAIFDDGLVLILKELHDRLDVAVAEAYGWPVDLPEEDLLGRLVALNKERAKEEKRGLVRWLRPDYQIPRFGSASEKAKQLEADLGGSVEALAPGEKATFPKGELEQTVAVMAALAHADGPLDAGTIAAAFKPGRKVRTEIGDVLVALYRMGQAASSDGGKTFALRRAA